MGAPQKPPRISKSRHNCEMSGSCCCCFVCVREMNAGVIETCGKFSRIAPPGCHCIMFPYETLSARVSLKVKHTEISCETKSKDNVFVTVIVAGNKGELPIKSTSQSDS